MDDVLRDRLIKILEERFSGDSSGHDLQHTLRVYRLSVTIHESEGGDRDIIELASLLHDVDDRKLFKQGNEPFAVTTMRNLGCDENTISKVINIISKISFKGTDTEIPDSLEGRIVQDADRLDAIGAIGIARAFAYGGSKGRSMHNPDEKPQLDMDSEKYFSNKGTTINHFYEKLLLLKNMMNTETGRRLAEDRHFYMEGFLEEFFEEWNGKK